MIQSRIYALFLACTTMLQCSVFGFTSFDYIRVEIDPYAPSIQANCSATFQSDLQQQIQGWVNNGLAIYFGLRNDQHVPYNQTYQRGWRGQWKKDRDLEEQRVPEEYRGQLRASVVQKPSSDSSGNRKLCSMTTCFNCCRPACIIYCGCHLCGRNRQLAWSSQSSSSSSVSNQVAIVVQVLASLWIAENDLTGCMGNPWQTSVLVDFVKSQI